MREPLGTGMLALVVSLLDVANGLSNLKLISDRL